MKTHQFFGKMLEDSKPKQEPKDQEPELIELDPHEAEYLAGGST